MLAKEDTEIKFLLWKLEKRLCELEERLLSENDVKTLIAEAEAVTKDDDPNSELFHRPW